jgi:CheY-like chemotaxis protein
MVSADEPAPAQNDAPKGGEAVLVVDDNVELRHVAARQLTGLGYRVSEAGDGPAALALIDQGGTFDLLFTDIGLPKGMNGFELAALARRRLPDVKVLFTTGYGTVGPRDGRPEIDPAAVLHKPYRGRDLALRVRAVFDG